MLVHGRKWRDGIVVLTAQALYFHARLLRLVRDRGPMHIVAEALPGLPTRLQVDDGRMF
jgi:hypothetical protein